MAGLNTGERTRAEAVNVLFSALATERARGVVDYFRESGDSVASVEDLAEYLADQEPFTDRRGSERIAIHLHHASLPKLADAGVLTYDPGNRIVRYRGHPLLREVSALRRFADPDGTA